MGNEYNITMKQYNGTDYDILYPATGGRQVVPSSSVLEQFNIINSINTLGNYANLDDVLGYLGTLNMYWWKRRSTSYNVQIGNLNNTTVGINNNSYIVYGDLAANGTNPSSDLIIANPQTITPPLTVEKLNVLKNNLYKVFGYGYTSDITTPQYYLGSTLLSFNDNNAGLITIYNIDTMSNITITEQTGDWEYVQSTSSSTYPQSGEQDGYEYVFLGSPFQNIINSAQIEVGSYTGTGSYGLNSKNTYTFSRPPKFVIILGDNDYISYAIGFYVWGMKYMGGGIVADGGKNYAYPEGNQLSWFSAASSVSQLNQSGVKYYVVSFY